MDLSSSVAVVNRYTPPNQRDWTNSYVNDGDKVQEDRSHPPSLIALKGCCSSEAYQLLNNRWAAAMSAYENPSTDLSEKPVMYSRSWVDEVKVQEDCSDPPSLIVLKGCCSSEAYQLLNNRWAAAMSAYENPSTDLFEKPVMYFGSWADEVEASGHQIDFLSELRRAMNH